MISVHPLAQHTLPALGAEGGNEAPNEALATSSDTPASLPLASHALKSMPLAAGGLLLASCGGGGSSGGGISFGPAQTDTEAARFLSQAGFSASTESMAAVRSLGLSDWLDSQLAMPVQGISRYEWMVSNGYAVEANRTNFTGADNAIWLKFMSSPDPVRQRMTLALSEIFVVSMQGLPIEWRGLCIAHYADLLERHAFGTYRQLLQEVTLSVGMGSYLNMLGNRKEDTKSGRVPDENFAREVMQLFSIGLQELNPDGSPRLVNGKPVESYTSDDVKGLAKVFTGYSWWIPPDKTSLEWWRCFYRDSTCKDERQLTTSMSSYPQEHSISEKKFLGVTIAAQTTPNPAGDLRIALACCA